MRISPSHLKKHSLTSSEYLLKFPDATMVDPLIVQKIAGRNQGQTRSTETKAKISAAKVKQYASDPGLRERVSEGTKVGMREPVAWERFQTGIAGRDPIALAKNFKSLGPEIRAKMYTPERNARVSVGKLRWWDDGRRGQTIEQLYGDETGKRVRALKSEQTQGEKNPAFGKVYDNVGRKVGRYKGKLFRSVWEYSFYRHLESISVSLEQVEYEPFRIPYKLHGKSRTYHPDVLVKSLALLVEIKCEYELQKKKGSRMRTAKFEAAQKFCSDLGLEFCVMTEKHFKIQPYSIAYADPNVEWIKK